jgi:hypothetical protein
MNTGRRNAFDRPILRGPRGGLYVIGPSGRKIRVAAMPASPAAAAVVPTNIRGRVIHTGARGGRYVLEGGRKIYKFTVAAAAGPAPAPPVASPRLPKHLRKAMKFNNNGLYMTKSGGIFTKTGTNAGASYNNAANMAIEAYARDPKFLYKKALPFKNETTSGRFKATEVKMKSGESERHTFRLFYNRSGFLHYMRLNNKPIFTKHPNANHWGLKMSQNLYNNMVRRVARENASFPRRAIPPNVAVAAPAGGRTTAVLMNMMINRIYGGGGRRGHINVSNMTAAEKTRIANHIKSQINSSAQMRNARKRNAVAARARGNYAAAAHANERYGYFNNSVRAMTRGYRALKPLTGLVSSPAVTAATPNRYSPAPAGTENVIMTGNLESPHIVIKVPGSQTLYMNPNSLLGMIKNGTGANVKNTNLRAWLRMARRNFPNEPLFRHYINRAKNVMPKHIRFSSA